jgi:hypothetical protein
MNIVIILTVRFPAEARGFLCSTASREDLCPTQPPMQGAPEAHSPVVKRQELYFHAPARLHGVVKVT